MQVYSATSLEKALKKDFLGFYGDESPAIVRDLCFTTTSTHDSEKYEWLGQAPQMDEFKDEVKFNALSDTSYTLTNKVYTGGLALSRDDIRRNETGSLTERVRQQAQRARGFAVKLLIDAIEANGNCYDGTAFFGNSHTVRNKESAVQDNNLAISGTTTAYIQTDLALALQAMLGFQDEEGQPFHGDISQPKLTIVCALNLLRNMREAVYAPIISSTSNVNMGFAEVYPSARLTSSTWYMFRTDGPKPMVFQEEQPVLFEAVESGDTAVTKRQYQYVVSWAGAVGYGFWQSAVKVA